MSEIPFPKPSPGDPLPLEEWLNRTDRAKIGREPFFRGRDKEYDVFRRMVNSLRAGHAGEGSSVFQGAPGAGKSALMNECMEAVRRHSTPEEPWLAVSISPGFLDSPLDVIETMIDAARRESKHLKKAATELTVADVFENLSKLAKKLGKQLSKRGGGAFGVKIGGSKDDNVTTIGRVFRGAAPLLQKFRIVVFVDEAQNVPINDRTRSILDFLHRDPQGIPLVASFFGLSDTQQVLRQCGLSRLADERLVNLEALSSEDTVCAIRSVFDAYDFKGTSEDRETWVDRLAKLSQGWPQHINRVSVMAARVIQEHGGQINMEHLEEALERGKERMDFYYGERLDAGSSDAWVYRQIALAMEAGEGNLLKYEIGSLTEFARKEESQTVNEFLTNALHAGLLAPTRNSSSRYRIPIPSMGDYLRALEEEPPPQFRK